MKKKTMQITKGRDPYLDMTALSDYCREKGYKVVKEIVTIRMPEGKELAELLKDIEAGKILVVP